MEKLLNSQMLDTNQLIDTMVETDDVKTFQESEIENGIVKDYLLVFGEE